MHLSDPFPIRYISRFRASSKLSGESLYYMTNLNAAITFIEKLDHSSLKIEPNSYRNLVKDAEKDYYVYLKEKQQAKKSIPRSVSVDSKLSSPSPTINLKNTIFEKPIQMIGKFLAENFNESRSESPASNSKESVEPSPVFPGNSSAPPPAENQEFEFELQLAMALSLSEQQHKEEEERRRSSATSPAPQAPKVQDEKSLIDFDME